MSNVQVIPNILGGIMFISIFALFILLFVFWVLMVADALKRPMDGATRIAWILVLLFMQLIGAIIYYFVVKRNSPITVTTPPHTLEKNGLSNSNSADNAAASGQ